MWGRGWPGAVICAKGSQGRHRAPLLRASVGVAFITVTRGFLFFSLVGWFGFVIFFFLVHMCGLVAGN